MGPNRINNVLSGEEANHHFTEGEKKTGEVASVVSNKEVALVA